MSDTNILSLIIKSKWAILEVISERIPSLSLSVTSPPKKRKLYSNQAMSTSGWVYWALKNTISTQVPLVGHEAVL